MYLLAGIVKRSPSTTVLDIGITMSFSHQISDYIIMPFSGVKTVDIISLVEIFNKCLWDSCKIVETCFLTRHDILVYSGTSLFQPHSGPAKVAGLVGWLDLRETSLIQPYYDMAELAGLASFTQACV